MPDGLTIEQTQQVMRISGGSRLLTALCLGSISAKKAFGNDGVDSAAEFFLRHGCLFAPQPLPPRYRKGKGGLHDCQRNAFLLATSCPELDYAEGYALPAASPPDMPMEHAWCVAADGHVLDPTWTGRLIGCEYCGLAFDKDFLFEPFRRGEPFGLLFNERLFLEVVRGQHDDWRKWLSKRAAVPAERGLPT